MKNINKFIFLGLALVMAWGCKKDEIITTLNPNAAVNISLSAATTVLNKDNAATDAVTVSWAKPDYGFNAAPSYSVLIDKKGNNFAKPVNLSVGADLKKTFKTSELNGILIGLGLVAGTAGDIEFKVQSLIGSSTVLTSNIASLKATAYSDKLDLTSPWGVVGSGAPNGWDGPDLPFYVNPDNTAEHIAYVTLKDGEIKFRKNNAWTDNLGGSNGTLKANGDNIAIKAGSYKITMNPTALTYKIDKFSWGIVGDATPNGWNGPDVEMRYDPTVDLFRAEVTLIDGKIKFRQNNDWGVNLGGANGTLSAGGADISVTKGTYLITMDPKKLKYTVTAYSPWGLVGDATTNGWNGPDAKFTYDLSSETWVLTNVTLKAGQIKFRQNDDWGNNLGSTGNTEPDPIATSGGLKAGGKNFGVTAGTWSFELDLKDVNNPKYKATKK